MIEAGVVAQFEAAHALRGEFGRATRRHGHTYRVEVTIRGDSLKEDGTLFDLGLLQDAVSHATGELDYRDLDELACFAGRNSTAEEVARFLCEMIAPSLQGAGLAALHVRVWESANAFAAWEIPIAP